MKTSIKQKAIAALVALPLFASGSIFANEQSLDLIAQDAMAKWRCSVLATVLQNDDDAKRLYGAGKDQMQKFAERYVDGTADLQSNVGQFALILSLTLDAIPRHIVKGEPIDVLLSYVFARTQTRVIAELKTVIGAEDSFGDVLQAHLQTVKNQYSAFNCRLLSGV